MSQLQTTTKITVSTADRDYDVSYDGPKLKNI